MSVRDKNRRTAARRQHSRTPVYIPFFLALRLRGYTTHFSTLNPHARFSSYHITPYIHTVLLLPFGRSRSFDPSLPPPLPPSSTGSRAHFNPYKGPLSLITIAAAGILLLFGHAKATVTKKKTRHDADTLHEALVEGGRGRRRP